MDDETKKQIEELKEKLQKLKDQNAAEKQKEWWLDYHRKAQVAKSETVKKIVEILTDKELIGIVASYEVCDMQKDIINSVKTLL